MWWNKTKIKEKRELENKELEEAIKIKFEQSEELNAINDWAKEINFGSRFDSVNNLNNPHFEHIQKLRGYLQTRY